MVEKTGRTQMKKTFLVALALVLAWDPVPAVSGAVKFPKGSMVVAGQIGLNTYVRTADPWADPFQAMPFPVGGSFEFFVSDHLGIGGTVMFDQWSDYLGMFGGKYTFRLFKPSFDVAYHFRPGKMDGLDLFAGTSLGYSLLSVGNELGNVYKGNLRNEPHLAPFLGTHLHFWENLSGFLGRLMLTLKVTWSVTGNFSGVYGTAGIAYRI